MPINKQFITLSEQSRRFEVAGMFWLAIEEQGRVMPSQWSTAAIYAEDPTTCPFILPWLQDNLNFLTTADNHVHVEFATVEAREHCRWLAQHAFAERNSRFMETFYGILAMTNKNK